MLREPIIITNNFVTNKRLDIKKLQFIICAPIEEEILISFSKKRDSTPHRVHLTPCAKNRRPGKQKYPYTLPSYEIYYYLNAKSDHVLIA